jgi:hypothetical protein
MQSCYLAGWGNNHLQYKLNGYNASFQALRQAMLTRACVSFKKEVDCSCFLYDPILKYEVPEPQSNASCRRIGLVALFFGSRCICHARGGGNEEPYPHVKWPRSPRSAEVLILGTERFTKERNSLHASQSNAESCGKAAPQPYFPISRDTETACSF